MLAGQHWRCGAAIPYDTLASHMAIECTLRLVSCRLGCGAIMQVRIPVVNVLTSAAFTAFGMWLCTLVKLSFDIIQPVQAHFPLSKQCWSAHDNPVNNVLTLYLYHRIISCNHCYTVSVHAATTASSTHHGTMSESIVKVYTELR